MLMFDLFEQHALHPNATMCNDEIDRAMAFYPKAKRVEGLINDPSILAVLKDRKVCFGHYDVGWDDAAVNALWEALTPGGILLLDNYGHLASATWRFDAYFEKRGEAIIRLPWSEQGLVFKRKQ